MSNKTTRIIRITIIHGKCSLHSGTFICGADGTKGGNQKRSLNEVDRWGEGGSGGLEISQRAADAIFNGCSWGGSEPYREKILRGQRTKQTWRLINYHYSAVCACNQAFFKVLKIKPPCHCRQQELSDRWIVFSHTHTRMRTHTHTISLCPPHQHQRLCAGIWSIACRQARFDVNLVRNELQSKYLSSLTVRVK